MKIVFVLLRVWISWAVAVEVANSVCVFVVKIRLVEFIVAKVVWVSRAVLVAVLVVVVFWICVEVCESISVSKIDDVIVLVRLWYNVDVKFSTLVSVLVSDSICVVVVGITEIRFVVEVEVATT